MVRSSLIGVVAAAGLAWGAAAQTSVGTAFTYQGQLDQSGTGVTGSYDLQFRLFNDTTQVGSTLCADNVQVSGGRFTVSLDFGAQFAGQKRFLDISVRQDATAGNCSSGVYTQLTPRQELTAGPNAVWANQAANATQLNGLAPTFYTNAGNVTSGTLADARLSTNIPRLNAVNSFTGTTNTFTGSVGVGVTPATPLDVALGDKRMQFRFDGGLVPAINLTGTGSNLGILRLRNSLEVHPNDAGTASGHIDVRNAAGSVMMHLYGDTGDIVNNGALIVDADGSNTGTLSSALRIGGTGSGEGLLSLRVGSTNQLGLDFLTNFTSRMSITNAGNVGIGTTAPTSKLTVAGAIQTTSGGVVYPDGTSQTTAYVTPINPSSGLPVGSTVTTTYGGTAVTVKSPLEMSAAVVSGTVINNLQTYQPGNPASPVAMDIERTLTSDRTWWNWWVADNAFPTGRPFVMTLTIGGGGGQVVWTQQMAITAYEQRVLTGGAVVERISVKPTAINTIARTRSGNAATPQGTPNVGGSPAYTARIAGVDAPNAVVTQALREARGNSYQPTGPDTIIQFSGGVSNTGSVILMNPTGPSANLYGSIQGAGGFAFRLTYAGQIMLDDPNAFTSSYRVFLGSDGLPVEEYTVRYDSP